MPTPHDTSQRPPVITSNSGAIVGVWLSDNGLAKYSGNVTQTGSSVFTTLVVQKPHRFNKIALILLTSAGNDDVNGFTVNLYRILGAEATLNPQAAVSLLSTGSTPVTSESVVLLGGTAWEEDGCTYDLETIGAVTDVCYFDFYIQYL